MRQNGEISEIGHLCISVQGNSRSNQSYASIRHTLVSLSYLYTP